MAHPKLQEKIEHLKSRLKGLHQKIGGGIKGSVFAAGTGAAGFYVLDMAVEKVEFLKKDYVLPALLVVGGHLVKRKQYDIGTAIIAIGAFLAAQTFKTNSSKETTTTTTTTTPTSGGALPASTTPVAAGYDGGNAGWMMVDGGRAGDAGALMGGGSTSQEPRQLRSAGELVPAGTGREAMALID
jgi:hypothetical protein